MNNLTIAQTNLPNTLEDLSKFVLVGREKLTAVRAEIRAIDKVQLAQEVREQKKEEAQMLAEALLDAEVRIGDLLKQIPKASGGDRKSIKFKNDTDVDFEQPVKNSVNKLETKKETIERLGFNQKQAERFETLSSNKEIVEQVKAEARENEDIPTRSRVLQLVKQNKDNDNQETDLTEKFKGLEREKAISDNYDKAFLKARLLNIEDEDVEIWLKWMPKEDRLNITEILKESIENINYLIEKCKKINNLKVVK